MKHDPAPVRERLAARVGVDTGGTFTDLVLVSDGRVAIHKVPSTPAAPERAIIQGLSELCDAGGALSLVHGTTVATNAVLEGDLARTAYVGDEGLTDLIEIGRQTRRELYALEPTAIPCPVPAELRLGVPGRLGADGDTVVGLTEEDLSALRRSIAALAPEAVAINMLFSFMDDTVERRIESAMPEGVFVSRSSSVLPEYREYERGIATWLNAAVGPKVSGYIRRLMTELERVHTGSELRVNQSAGGTLAAEQAATHGAHLLLSGPAGGLVGALHMAGLSGRRRLMTLDMGGTSTDVALLDGEVRLTGDGRIAGYPVALPMVDMHTIGAGGGSIASLDAGGMLQVGPASAGADPGPACYGRGGLRPTVTDANLSLGRIDPERFLGGRMAVDQTAAGSAIAGLAEDMGVDPRSAARGIVELADEHMTRALRVISVERGYDPAGFTLVSFGGAGGLHVCSLAERMGMSEAMVPAHAGVLSALGMLAARPARERSRSLLVPVSDCSPERLRSEFAVLADQASRELTAEGIDPRQLEVAQAVELRYLGQDDALRLPLDGEPEQDAMDALSRRFHQAHEERYGHRLDEPVELVTLRVGVAGPAPELALPELPAGVGVEPSGWVGTTPVFLRDALGEGDQLEGPALIAESVSTTWLAEGWAASVDRWGNLILSRLR